MASFGARSAIDLVHALRLHRLFAPMQAGIGAILAFHRVLPRTDERFAPNAALAVTPEYFAAVIEFLQERNYEIVTLWEALQRIFAGDSPRRFCCLTFDDGYRDNFLHALPLARRFGVPITVFVTTGFLDGASVVWWLALEHLVRAQAMIEFAWRDRMYRLLARDHAEKAHAYGRVSALLSRAEPSEIAALFAHWRERYGTDFAGIAAREMLSWADLNAMVATGSVEIGAHTVHHRCLSRLDQTAARAEMAESRQTLETRLRRPIAFLAYPYGRSVHAGAREYELAAELGFAMALTMRHGTVRRTHRTTPHALPRITMNAAYADLPALDVFLSGTIAALLPAAAQ